MFNRTKIITFVSLMLIIMLTSCSNSSVDDKNKDLSDLNKSINKTENYNEGTYTGNIIKNNSVAKKYANMIMRNTLKQNLEDYKKVDVSFDENQNIWIVNYFVDEQTLGGDITIEISKKNGEVSKISFGE